MTQHLTLRDQVYLLAHDERGRARIHGPSLSLGLAGAVLIDLVLAERLTVTDGHNLVLRGGPKTGDLICDAVLATIGNAQRSQRAVRSWITALAVDITDRTGGRLHAAGLVSQTVSKKMFREPEVLYWCTDPALIVQICGLLRYAINGSNYIEPAHLALCDLIAVLRLQRLLNIDLPTTDVIARLEQLGAHSTPAARHIMAAVRHLIGEQAVAAVR